MVLEHFLTDTADYADYVLPATTQLEHLDVHLSLRPHRRAARIDRRSRRSARRSPTRRSSASWRSAWASPKPASPKTTRACAAAPSRGKVDFDALLARRLRHAAAARGAVRRRRISHALGQVRVLQRAARAAGPGRPARPRAQVRGGARRSARYPAGDDLAAGAQLPQLELRQRAQPARHRGRAAARDARERRRGARHRRRRGGARLQRARRVPLHAPRCRRARGPAWSTGSASGGASSALDGTNVNELTSQRLTDIGRGPAFYDCLVEVQPA